MTDDDKRQTRPGFKPKSLGGRPLSRKRAPVKTAKESAHEGERIAKVMARAGLCSRRDAEAWIEAGRVAVNGTVLTSAAVNVTADDRVTIDGAPLAPRERTRLFQFHKPRGLVTTDHDPEGRPTVFSWLAENHPHLPRLVSIGRLDINTEGLLLLTNDGGLARVLELPGTGWLRRYRVRAHGTTTPEALSALREGITVEGVDYAPIEATLDRIQGANVWLTMGLREGKNREIKRVLEYLGLGVTRLIRISYGPFQLGEAPIGAAEEVRTRVLMDQLGPALIEQADADFDTPVDGEVFVREKAREPVREPPMARAPTRSRGPIRPERPDAWPEPARGARSEMPREKSRFSKDAPAEREQSAVRPKPEDAKRRHVSALRADRDDKSAPRVRIERGATKDRQGRAVTIERKVAATPAFPADTRNARRFRDEREDSAPASPRARTNAGPPSRTERGPKRDFEARPPRGATRDDAPGHDRKGASKGAARSYSKGPDLRYQKTRGASDSRPERPFSSERPASSERKPWTKDRPGGERSFDKAASGEKRAYTKRSGSAPARSEGSGHERPSGGSFGDRTSSGDKPAYAAKPYAAKPYAAKPYAAKPYAARSPSAGKPAYAGKRTSGERQPSGDRTPSGDRKPWSDRKPSGERAPSGDAKPYGNKRPSGGKPFSGKPSGARSGKPFGGKPTGTRPAGGKSSGGRPSGGKPSGSRPPRNRD